MLLEDLKSLLEKEGLESLNFLEAGLVSWYLSLNISLSSIASIDSSKLLIPRSMTGFLSSYLDLLRSVRKLTILE